MSGTSEIFCTDNKDGKVQPCSPSGRETWHESLGISGKLCGLRKDPLPGPSCARRPHAGRQVPWTDCAGLVPGNCLSIAVPPDVLLPAGRRGARAPALGPTAQPQGVGLQQAQGKGSLKLSLFLITVIKHFYYLLIDFYKAHTWLNLYLEFYHSGLSSTWNWVQDN